MTTQCARYTVSNLQIFNAPLKKVTGLSVVALTSLLILNSAQQAQAHHAMGGGLPTNLVQGFLSGLAHPLIGLDHFAFVVAIGLLAATKRNGIFLPITFLGTALVGSSLHLMRWSVPALEFWVSASVLLFGIFLAMKNRPSLPVLLGLGAIAGLFHGYAYAEAIFGSEMTPLVSYLVGFTVIQCVVAMLALVIGKFVLRPTTEQSGLSLRFSGFVISGAGALLLGTMLLNTIFPFPVK
jgi:urease accessory protein